MADARPLPLSDDPARHRIATDLDASMVIEASAGSGKTTVLVNRIVNLLTHPEHPVAPAELCAVTFTEKAATELRDRVRAAVAERDAGVALRLDDATITTIHGLALAICREHALDAGLPPEVTVSDDAEARAERERRGRAVVVELSSRDDGGLFLHGLSVGVEPRTVAALAVALDGHLADARRHVATRPERPPFEPPDLGPVLRALREAVGWRDCCISDDDKLAAHLDAVQAFLDDLDTMADEPLEVLRRLAPSKPIVNGAASASIRSNYGRKDWWPGGAKDDALAALEAAEVARRAVVDAVVQPVLATIVDAACAATVEAFEHRRAQGRLTFDDLLVIALDVLTGDPAARRRAAARWPVVLVDEFQDTDPEQVDLVTLLTATDDTAHLAVTDRVVRPGALVCVGDAKQSIYRFRGADPRSYRDAVGAIAPRGTELLLTSFRSVAGVCDFVNGVIGPLFAGDDQAPYAPLVPHRTDGRPTAVWHVGLGAVHDDAATARAAEASEIVEVIEALLRERPIVGEGARRHALRPSDIAVLLPTRLGLGALERALLAAGITYRVESRSLLFATQEVRDLAVTLRAVADPSDEVAVVAALRSSSFACSDRHLAEWVAAGGRWDPLRLPPEGVGADHPVADAMRELAALHRTSWQGGAHEVVRRITHERRLAALALAHPRPADRWRRVRFVADRALQADRAGAVSVASFARWLQERIDDDTPASDGHLPDLDDDAVRVLTIHAAKGLEFDVTVLAGLGGRPASPPPQVLIGDRGAIEVRLRDGIETSGYAAAKSGHDADEQAERVRLLYVAATRARDLLVVGLHHSKRNTSSAAATLTPVLLDGGARDLAVPASWGLTQLGGGEAQPPAPAPPSTTPVPEALPDPDAWVATRTHRLATAVRAPVVAATSLAALALDQAPHPIDDPAHDADDPPPWRRGRAGTAIGRAVHATLQSVDLATGDGLDALVDAHVAIERIGAHAHEVRAAARAALASPAVGLAVAGRSWRELYVAAPVGDTVLEGFVDLLVETADGRMVVVDWKTDAVTSTAELDAAVERYRLQGAAYALLVEATIGRAVHEVRFVFCRASGAIERTIAGLPEAVADVRDLVAGQGAGVRAPEDRQPT